MGLACGGVMIINEMVDSPRRELLAQGHDLEFNVTKGQVTAAAARGSLRWPTPLRCQRWSKAVQSAERTGTTVMPTGAKAIKASLMC